MESTKEITQATVDFLSEEAKKTTEEIDAAMKSGDKVRYLPLLRKSTEILGRMQSVLRSLNEE